MTSTPGCASASAAGATPLFEHVDRIPYVGLQQMLDEANAWGLYCYEKASTSTN